VSTTSAAFVVGAGEQPEGEPADAGAGSHGAFRRRDVAGDRCAVREPELGRVGHGPGPVRVHDPAQGLSHVIVPAAGFGGVGVLVERGDDEVGQQLVAAREVAVEG